MPGFVGDHFLVATYEQMSSNATPTLSYIQWQLPQHLQSPVHGRFAFEHLQRPQHADFYKSIW